jgi:hypothetical protein
MADVFSIRVEPRSDDPTRGVLFITCGKSPTGECRQSLWSKPAAGAMWHWDGNVENPTISPSIDCQGGCGRHFNVVNGEVV